MGSNQFATCFALVFFLAYSSSTLKTEKTCSNFGSSLFARHRRQSACITTMDDDTQDHWVFGLSLSSCILITKKHNISETESLFAFR
jgi:hypothetical protein